jgi:hypothetical protein
MFAASDRKNPPHPCYGEAPWVFAVGGLTKLVETQKGSSSDLRANVKPPHVLQEDGLLLIE